MWYEEYLNAMVIKTIISIGKLFYAAMLTMMKIRDPHFLSINYLMFSLVYSKWNISFSAHNYMRWPLYEKWRKNKVLKKIADIQKKCIISNET